VPAEGGSRIETAEHAEAKMNQAQPFPWFDESEIERNHDRMVAANLELRDHLRLFHEAFELLHQCLRNHQYENDAEVLTVLRIVARVFNTAGACLKLARAGYFQPAFTMVRDILEVEFLADLFVRDRTHLRRWIAFSPKERRKEFSPVKVRDRLDELDGYKERKRAQAYALLSQHAAHVDPGGFHVISPGNMTQIGPFPSESVLTALFQELAKHLQWACIHLLILLQPSDQSILSAKDKLERTLIAWRARYILES
jgi:hypothetical protein